MIIQFQTDKEKILNSQKPYYITSNYQNAIFKLGGEPDGDLEDVFASSINLTNELLTNSFYIFMTIILILIILSAILFGIREYSLSMMKKFKCDDRTVDVTDWESTMIMKRNTDEDCGDYKDSVILTSENLIQKNNSNGLNDTGLTQFNSVERLNLPRYQLSSNVLTLSYDSSNASSKLIYTIEELSEFNYDKEKALVQNCQVMMKSSKKQRIPMSKLISCQIEIPQTRFQEIYEYTKALNEIKKYIVYGDTILKSLYLLKFISISKSDNVKFNLNPNMFFELFVEVEKIIICGVDFDNVYLKVMIVELVLSFSWAHYRFDEFENINDHVVNRVYSNWGLKPFVLSRSTIFKDLILFQSRCDNFETDIESETDLKIGLVIRGLISHSKCNDYIGFIPIIQESMNKIESVRNILFYTEILKLLILRHENCCMTDYLEDVNNAQLKWILDKCSELHDTKIDTKITEIIFILMKINPGFKNWKTKFETSNYGIMNYNNGVNTTRINEPVPLSTDYTALYFTPKVAVEKKFRWDENTTM